ncbi:MAG: hypothetical protein AB1758_17630, partial [Candidatus Eremiobacterota bacterium]
MKVLHLIYGFYRAGAEVSVCQAVPRFRRWKSMVVGLHRFDPAAESELRAELEARGIPTRVLSGQPRT